MHSNNNYDETREYILIVADNMITIKLLPDRKTIKIDRNELKVKELIEMLDVDDIESLAIIVDGKLIEDEEYIIKPNNKVVVIRQGVGG
ncbi:MAG: thiamine biosynthesis protein ThiS [Staphylothermus sp.]|nr:thiamine biosynthesis protein ThiS [Staphylothermus sp.]